MENLFAPGQIRTNSGIYFDYRNPTVDMINIDDIVHALLKMPRFGGHLRDDYCVLEHLVRCARKLYTFETLMHDGHEAYMLDMPKPLKDLLPDYQIIEERVAKVFAKKFGLIYPSPKEVKVVDLMLLQEEWDSLMLGTSDSIKVTPREVLKTEFLEMFNDLYNKRLKGEA